MAFEVSTEEYFTGLVFQTRLFRSFTWNRPSVSWYVLAMVRVGEAHEIKGAWEELEPQAL